MTTPTLTMRRPVLAFRAGCEGAAIKLREAQTLLNEIASAGRPEAHRLRDVEDMLLDARATLCGVRVTTEEVGDA